MPAYAALYAFAVMGALFAVGGLIAAWALRPQVEDPIKRTTYECGMVAVGSTDVKTNVRFYVFALLFVIFDVEALFIFPWAVCVRALGAPALIEMLVFLVLLFLGLVYAWGHGALEWDWPAAPVRHRKAGARRAGGHS
ncbi:MAG: hypothetical protein A2X36_15275 [Elusimicrobia bacterium GWA2_69_24]|nr:MAG: hypothetical protein A2X36_15275 [Elusimicrobia bacterium GWA2_69_24]